MYNEDLKTRFVKQYTTSIHTAKNCETVFGLFEPYELIWNDDLCTRSAEELQPIVDSIAGFRARSGLVRIIMLKDYVKWCINVAKVPGACDGMLKITTTGLDKIRKQTVASPLHLQKYLDIVFTKESEKTVENIYRCYYWLAYAGMKEEDTLNVKSSDVDFENMVIHFGDTEFPIYREAIAAFKNCAELSQFVYNHPNYTRTVWKDRVDGDSLLRGVRSAPSIYSIRSETSKRAKLKEEESGMRLSYFRVWISGVFYRAYERELIGEEPKFHNVAGERMRGKTYKLESGRNTVDAKRRKIASDYSEDYQRWKLAFKI